MPAAVYDKFHIEIDSYLNNSSYPASCKFFIVPKSMTPQIRRLIFYILIVIFFILTFFIIPYSNGWHFDFDTFKFVKLGGLYLNVEPTEAKIQVDKLNFEIKSGFMKSGILIANLFPKTYYVSIQKDGYQSWNKNL